jgi:hypothetical protein
MKNGLYDCNVYSYMEFCLDSRLRSSVQGKLKHSGPIVWTLLFRKNMVCSPFGQFSWHTTNFVYPKFNFRQKRSPHDRFLLCCFESPSFHSSSSPLMECFWTRRPGSWAALMATILGWTLLSKIEFWINEVRRVSRELPKRKSNVHTIRRCEIYCSATVMRRNIGLDVGEYIR